MASAPSKTLFGMDQKLVKGFYSLKRVFVDALTSPNVAAAVSSLFIHVAVAVAYILSVALSK